MYARAPLRRALLAAATPRSPSLTRPSMAPSTMPPARCAHVLPRDCELLRVVLHERIAKPHMALLRYNIASSKTSFIEEQRTSLPSISCRCRRERYFMRHASEIWSLLEDDPAVTFRLLASKPTPMQPFCATRGCINGNQLLRARVESIKLACGWRSDDSYLEEDRLTGWVPIFLH